MRKIVVVLAPFTLVAVLTGLAAAGVTSRGPVKTTTANELSPAATAVWFAWSQTSPDHPQRANVRAEQLPVDGTDDFRVNLPGTRAWTGGIEGGQLVYQQIADGNSNIRLFNLASQTHAPNPEVNTQRWEWHPSITTDTSGDTWILFGRQNVSNWTQRILAFNVQDQTLRTLAETTNRRHSLIPGQVNGDWATWTACRPDCNVRYVNLLSGGPATVPRPDFVRHQYASSIAEDGTIYFARSGRGCGANVRIVRRETGDNTVMVDLDDRRDVFFTYTSDEAANHVYYDRVGCGSGAWNIYKFVDGP